MNRNQEAIRPRTIHAIIEDDLVLVAPTDDHLPPASAEKVNSRSGCSLPAGFRIHEKACLPESQRSRQEVKQAELEDLDKAIAEIGRQATFGFAALLELPVLLAMNKD